MLLVSSFSDISALVATGVVQYLVAVILYRLYYHPLSKLPGPKLWAITRIPYSISLQRGNLAHSVRKLHEQYGPAVHIAPNELSFISPQAWHDIYGHHQSRPNFPKNRLWMAPGPDGYDSILSANDADHSRYRRLLSHAFSERALKSQEHLLLQYVDLLVTRLKDQIQGSADDAATVDLASWLEFTTVDIVSDLSFGESFHCLENSQLHSWVSIVFDQFKFAAIFISIRFFPGVETLIRRFLAPSLAKKRQEHMTIANSRIQKRLENGVDPQRNDFITFVQRYNDDRSMSEPEIKATFRSLVIAGSETTATTLVGIMNFLLKSPDACKLLVDEIRTSFNHASDISADSVTKLPYLTAVIDEGLRMAATVPTGMPRVVPEGGAQVDGRWLPGGTFVSASQYASNYSRLYWDDPDTFAPERFLNDHDLTNRSADKTDSKDRLGKEALNSFSLGPRNCLGRNLAWLEMRLILAKLLWEFDFELEGQPWNWSSQKTWILWDKKSLMVRIKPQKRQI